MAKINSRDFIGTRCRLQRLRDAKVFNGWIDDFLGSSVDISTSTENHLEIGEEFRFEGFGHHISVVFNGRLVECHEDFREGAWRTAAQGSTARVIEVTSTLLRLAVSGPVRYSASPESVRMLCPDLPIRIAYGSNEVQGIAVDVGPNGVGVLATEQIDPGTAIAAFIETPSGKVTAQALVRYCRTNSGRPGYCRFGLMFTDMGRLDRPRWERFLKELS